MTSRAPISDGRATGGLTPADWRRLLEAELGERVEVRFGRARRTVIRTERGARGLVVRMSSMFADAPGDVQHALARWLHSGRRARRACRRLDQWIDERLARLHRDEPRPIRVRTLGRHHDLAELADELRRGELRGELDEAAWPRITWGRAGKSRTRHSLRLGSFDYLTRVVRIHPVLDQPWVPAWFVRFVLFHELLHAVVGQTGSAERREHHGPEFRRRERGYSDTRRAERWEARHIASLIRSARTGRTPRRPQDPALLPRPEPARRSWVQHRLFP